MNNALDLRVNEILTANGLDFTIEKLPMIAEQPIMTIGNSGLLEKGTKKVHTPYFGLLNSKTGEVINTVKKGYEVSQNAEIVELVLRGIESFGSELSVHNAGSLNGGRRVFIQLAIEGTSKVGDDTVKKYITIIDSNDGSTGLSIGIGDYTMSCANQFFQFNKLGQSRMRHSASLKSRILEIPLLIENALEQSMLMQGTYERFATTGVSNADVHGLVDVLIGLSKASSIGDLADATTQKLNVMDTLYANIRTEMAQKGNTVWGLHSGITRWTTHDKSATKRLNGRIESAMLGANYKTNQQSLAYAKELLMA